MLGQFGLDLNSLGHLTIGGVDTIALSAQYGTPLFVINERQLRNRCREYVEAMSTLFLNGRAAYACKAFCCKEMCRIADAEGMSLDVVSLGELHTALSAGFPPHRMILHGSNKSTEELATAVKAGIGRIVVDGFWELERLAELTEGLSTHVGILLRIRPDVAAHTHHAVETGREDSKFGFSLVAGEALEAVALATRMTGVRLFGLHCHIGSQISECAPYELAVNRMVQLLAKIKRRFGVELPELNLGGGLAIRYAFTQKEPPAIGEYLSRISIALKEACGQYNVSCPSVTVEPGRSIVGPCGITLYTVGAIKRVESGRTYISVDGGMADNPRYALYQSQYEAVTANRAGEPRSQRVSLAGRCCESGDLLGEEMPLQSAKAGEIIAVLATGAYNFSMASNYNRLPRPSVVMTSDGHARLVVRRQTIDDLIANDL